MNCQNALYDDIRTMDYQGSLTDEDCLNIADMVLAAGYRRIPDDCVVVKREDAETIYHKWEFQIGRADMGFDYANVERDREVKDRLRESLGIPPLVPKPRAEEDDDDRAF